MGSRNHNPPPRRDLPSGVAARRRAKSRAVCPLSRNEIQVSRRRLLDERNFHVEVGPTSESEVGRVGFFIFRAGSPPEVALGMGG